MQPLYGLMAALAADQASLSCSLLEKKDRSQSYGWYGSAMRWHPARASSQVVAVPLYLVGMGPGEGAGKPSCDATGQCHGTA